MGKCPLKSLNKKCQIYILRKNTESHLTHNKIYMAIILFQVFNLQDQFWSFFIYNYIYYIYVCVFEYSCVWLCTLRTDGGNKPTCFNNGHPWFCIYRLFIFYNIYILLFSVFPQQTCIYFVLIKMHYFDTIQWETTFGNTFVLQNEACLPCTPH